MKDLSGFIERVKDCNTGLEELPTLTPFLVGGKEIGKVKPRRVPLFCLLRAPSILMPARVRLGYTIIACQITTWILLDRFLEQLRRWPDTFVVDGQPGPTGCVSMASHLDTAEKRSRRMAGARHGVYVPLSISVQMWGQGVGWEAMHARRFTCIVHQLVGGLFGARRGWVGCHVHFDPRNRAANAMRSNTVYGPQCFLGRAAKHVRGGLPLQRTALSSSAVLTHIVVAWAIPCPSHQRPHPAARCKDSDKLQRPLIRLPDCRAPPAPRPPL